MPIYHVAMINPELTVWVEAPTPARAGRTAERMHPDAVVASVVETPAVDVPQDVFDALLDYEMSTPRNERYRPT